METKVTNPLRLTSKWVWMNIKQYKRWFLLTAVLLTISAIVLPILLDLQHMPFVMIGLLELFLMSFIMVQSQFSFLHDSKAFSYYQSKALSLKSRVHGIIVTQAIFSFGFYLLLMGWTHFANTYLWSQSLNPNSRWINLEIFKMAGCWIAILLLLTALSALISGTKSGSAFSVIFNFCLPVLFLGIVYFVLNVANTATVGFNLNVINHTFVSKYYQVNLLYHYWSPGASTLLILPLTLILIYAIMIWVIKHRQNEYIGQSFVFKGYKLFVLFVLSMIVPLLFSVWIPNKHVVSKWIAILIISELTLYSVLGIVEKNLKLNSKSIKLLVSFGLLITLIIGGTSVFLRQYAQNVPDLETIEAVLLSPTTMVPLNENKMTSFYQVALSDDTERTPIYYSEEAKRSIIELHQLLLDNDEALLNVDFNIIYYLKDGSKRIFPFSPLPPNVIYEDGFDGFNTFADKMMALDEFWKIAEPILYSDDIKRANSANVYVQELGTFILDSSDIDVFIDLIRSENSNYKENYDFWANYPSLTSLYNYTNYDAYKYEVHINTNLGQVYNINIYDYQTDLIEWVEKQFN